MANPKLTAANIVNMKNSSQLNRLNSIVESSQKELTDIIGNTKRAVADQSEKFIKTIQKNKGMSKKTFATQEYRNTFEDISFPDTSNMLDNLPDNQKAAIEKLSGITINTEQDLVKALDISTDNFKGILENNTDITKLNEIMQAPILDVNKQMDILTKDFPELSEWGDLGSIYKDIDLSNIPNITDLKGLALEGLPLDIDVDLFNQINNAIGDLCPDNLLDAIRDNLKNLSLFNYLLGLCSLNGLTSLIDRLVNCSNYFEFNGSKVLGAYIPDILKKGDTITLGTISKYVKKSDIPDVVDYSKSAIKNMKDSEAYIEGLDKTLGNWNLQGSDIYKYTKDDLNITGFDVSDIKELKDKPKVKEYLFGDALELATLPYNKEF